MADVIDFEGERLERSPHATFPSRCVSCGHEWQTVSPIPVASALECPRCGGGSWRIAREAPQGVWLATWREGEKNWGNAMLMHDTEWCAPDGRTTATHSTYLPPTHFFAIPDPSPINLPKVGDVECAECGAPGGVHRGDCNV